MKRQKKVWKTLCFFHRIFWSSEPSIIDGDTLLTLSVGQCIDTHGKFVCAQGRRICRPFIFTQSDGIHKKRDQIIPTNGQWESIALSAPAAATRAAALSPGKHIDSLTYIDISKLLASNRVSIEFLKKIRNGAK